MSFLFFVHLCVSTLVALAVCLDVIVCVPFNVSGFDVQPVCLPEPRVCLCV